MGRRKFRLHRRKGYSRSIPRPCTDWETLCTNVKVAELGEWSYVSCIDLDVSSSSSITLCKFNSAIHPPLALMTITISCSTIRNWNLHVGHTCISREIFDHSVPSTICSLSDVNILVNSIDKLNVCTGIDDKRFVPLIESHKGIFHNQHGEFNNYDK